MAHLLFVLAVIFAVFAVAACLYRQKTLRYVLVVAALAVLVGFSEHAWLVVLEGFILGITALFRFRQRTFALVTGCVLAACLGPVIWWAEGRAREVTALEREYQPVSLRPRLPPRIAATPSAVRANSTPAELSQPWELVEQRINQMAYLGDISRRERSLESLLVEHRALEVEFGRALGFGVMRTLALPARREWIELPEPRPIPMASLCAESEQARSDPSSTFVLSHLYLEDAPQLPTFHAQNVVNFVNVPGFGVRHGVERVVGFQSHAFRAPPPTLEHQSRRRPTTRWTIDRLELVSLLRHDSPVAYLSENLPRMDELKHAPTRPLDTFEATALEKLCTGEELVVEEAPGRIRMLGSIRALKQCIECHDHALRGDLLGAFSYELRPVK